MPRPRIDLSRGKSRNTRLRPNNSSESKCTSARHRTLEPQRKLAGWVAKAWIEFGMPQMLQVNETISPILPCEIIGARVCSQVSVEEVAPGQAAGRLITLRRAQRFSAG